MNAHRMASWPSLRAGLLLLAVGAGCALNPQPEPPGATAASGTNPPYVGTGGSAGADQPAPLKEAGTGSFEDASMGSGGSTAGAGGTTGQGGAAVLDAAADVVVEAPAVDAPADTPALDARPDAEGIEASDDGG
jgi:hypothetical protein